MKRLYKLFMLIFFVIVSHLEAQTFIHGDFFSMKKYSQLNYLGTDSNNMFYLSSKQGKRSYLLMRFDQKTLKLISKKKIEFDDSREEIVLSVLSGDRLSISTEKRQRQMEPVRHSYLINCYTLAVLDDSIVEHQHHSPVSLYTANNHIRYYQVTELFFSTGWTMDQMDLTEKIEKLTLNSAYHTTEAFESDASIYLYKKFYSRLTLYAKSSDGAEQIRQIDLGENKKILEYEVKPFKDGRLRILGKYYSNTKNIETYGLFQIVFDRDLKAINQAEMLPLIEGKNPEQDLKNHPNFQMIFPDKKNCIVDTDFGNLLYIYNKITITNELVSSTTFDGQQSRTTYHSVNFTNVFEINMIHFHPSGKIWKQTIPLKQRTSEHEVSVSFICKIINQNLCFLFFDHKGNLKKQMNDMDVKTCYFKESSVMVKCLYDMDKNILGKKEVFLRQNEFIQFFDLQTYRISPKDEALIQLAGKSPKSRAFRLQKIQM